MERKDKVEGEGSYSGTKDYNERTKKFVDSGKVDRAANDAAPKSPEEEREMQKAERLGKQHAKGEDPALKDPKAVNFVDLRNWVLELPGFDDEPKRSGEKILEAIQMLWIEEAD